MDALPGVVIVIMQSGGALEDYAFRQASSSLDALLARSPIIAHRRKGDSMHIEEINVSDIQVGEHFRETYQHRAPCYNISSIRMLQITKWFKRK